MALPGLRTMAWNCYEPYFGDDEASFGHASDCDWHFFRDPFCAEDEWLPMSDSFFDDIDAFVTHTTAPAFLIDPVYVEKTSMYLELASDLLNEPSRSLQFNISSEIFCCEKHFWGLRTSVSPGHIACNNHRRLTCGYEDCPKFSKDASPNEWLWNCCNCPQPAGSPHQDDWPGCDHTNCAKCSIEEDSATRRMD